MRKDKQKIKPDVNVGLISLLMIFMTLCLTVFVALAVTSAVADRSLTNRTGETAVSYYNAQNQFQEFLRDLDANLFEVNQNDLIRVGDLYDGRSLDNAVSVGYGDVSDGANILSDSVLEVLDSLLKEGLKPLMKEGISYDEALRMFSCQWPAGERLRFKAEIALNPMGFFGVGPRYIVRSVLVTPVQENYYTPMDNLWNGEDLFYVD
jgi:hypothetical protein